MDKFTKGDKVIITNNDWLQHNFEIGQECTYIQDYGGNIHELKGKNQVNPFADDEPIKQSVSGTCFKKA